MVFESLEPKLVWEIFEDVFTKTPRESKKEDKIREKLKSWIPERAKSLGIEIEVIEDEAGNILVKKGPTKGMESTQPLLLQGHMDMVCETDRPDGFDFDNNPIPVRIQDNSEWVDADGTTLGADNGIGTSLGLALMLDPDVRHGPLELLITVDEETGLVGAFALEPEKMGIESKLMVNVDSEELSVITIGSAGGGDTDLIKNLKLQEVTGEASFYDLIVSGLFGGHSGVDIHKHRANANKLVGRILSYLAAEMNVHLCNWNGGSKHNAITREATAKFAVETGKSAKAEELLEAVNTEIKAYYREIEPDIQISWEKSSPEPAFSLEESKKIIQSINNIPHGPIRFSPNVEGLVETSNNVAVVKTDGSEISVLLSSRSSVDSELESFRLGIADLAELSGWNVTKKPSYPGWNPEPKSPFLAFVRKHFEDVTGREVEVKAIHAGLECGIIGSKIPGIQMVSIGPSMENAHTPDERLKIIDVEVLYNLLKVLVEDLSNLKRLVLR
ncbi:MAG: beta-Ala-His dipeptidase [Candidatus Thorarchaeota archaeon]|jgi:dipeptidase D